MRKTGSTKQQTRRTILELKRYGQKHKNRVWKTLAKKLERPRRIRVSVNLWNLSKLAIRNKGKTLVVPGKVLGTGKLEKNIKIAGLEFSEKAREKIKAEKGIAITLMELMDEKPKAKELVIVG